MLKRFYFLILVCVVSMSVYAWTPNGETVTIDNIVQWQDNKNIVLKLSSGYNCYIPQGEDKLFSTALAIQISQKNVSVHCHDSKEDIGGYMAHRLHRIIVLK